jgi:hypothetical protein
MGTLEVSQNILETIQHNRIVPAGNLQHKFKAAELLLNLKSEAPECNGHVLPSR